ncbi:hypothetical protein GCM10009665_76720 [Kitasatospora nipponensis]|uniref:Uncharacterized protein n=1 Tax=Kitasatospora nipponensis TaxID=258049 RepID=A0ABP4DS83_9ACTN
MSDRETDIEWFMEQLANAGVTMILKVDHERMARGGQPWTIIMSGPGMGEKGSIHTDRRSLADCLEYGIGELRSRPGDWEWLDLLS